MGLNAIDVVPRARRVHEHASSLGFDWKNISGVLDKVREETDEIADALRKDDAEAARREFGDLYFTIVNLSRFLDADPNTELSHSCDRFESRFQDLQSEVNQQGKRVSECSLQELEVVWGNVKRRQAELKHNA